MCLKGNKEVKTQAQGTSGDTKNFELSLKNSWLWT